MAQETQTVTGTTDLNGTANMGRLDFDTSAADDTKRVVIFSASISSASVLNSARLVLAPDAGSITTGPYVELSFVEDAKGVSHACCECLVPAGWSLFAITGGGVDADKHFFCDYHETTKVPRRQV